MKDVIVLDIGTQFIKALTLGNDRFFIQENYGKNILDSCREIIKQASKKSKVKPKKILLGLNTDILKGETITLCFKRENSREPIDLIELKNLIQKIEWKALDKIKQEFSKETELKESDVKLINAHLIDIKIDGHSNLNPVGVCGENICISIYNVYTSINKFNGLKKLATELKLELKEMVPISFALYSYLDLEKNDALIIDIGEKTTEVTLIKNKGEIIETKNFHLGGQIFSRVLADFLSADKKTGELVKIKYSTGEISSDVKKKIEKLLIVSMSSWLSGIKIILNDFSKNYKFIPERIFICGGGSKLPIIKTYLKKENNVKIMDVNEKEDFLKISCLALKKFNNNLPDDKSVFAPIFKRVIKLIQN
jgi:hypothetical protein